MTDLLMSLEAAADGLERARGQDLAALEVAVTAFQNCAAELSKALGPGVEPTRVVASFAHATGAAAATLALLMDKAKRSTGGEAERIEALGRKLQHATSVIAKLGAARI